MDKEEGRSTLCQQIDDETDTTASSTQGIRIVSHSKGH